MSACLSLHPERGWACSQGAEDNHEFHAAFVDTGWQEWPNLGYVPPPPRRSQGIGRLVGLAQRTDEYERAKRRAVAAPVASVTVDDPRARRVGAERAHAAAEPEFRAAVVVAGADLCRTLGRWTADDMWDWLDAHGYVTEHPKAMTGLLRMLVGLGFIVPVPESDPDCRRPTRRSNPSRTLQVYESRP